MTPVPVLTEKVAIIGGGSWATALVKILSEQPIKIEWWLRNHRAVEHIRRYHHNPDYLADVYLNRRKVRPRKRLWKALEDAATVVIAVPAAFVKDALSEVTPEQLAGKRIVSAVKGMIPDEHLLVTDYMQQAFGILAEDLCVIAGPCHAEEVAMERQSYLTIAGADLTQAHAFADLMSCRFVRTQVSDDLYGIEYCAVLKNVVALACGICHGLNYGDNFLAVLVSNALQEIARFLERVAPRARDLHDSAYVGDLLVTAYSQFSRNRMFGNMIGRGYGVKAAQMEMNMVAEGYYAVRSLNGLMEQHQIDMPITRAVYHMLYERVSPAVEIEILKNLLH